MNNQERDEQAQRDKEDREYRLGPERPTPSGPSLDTPTEIALERDAARYRWLRANPIMAEVLFSRVIMDKWSVDELDAAIDRDRGATDGRAPGD